MSGFRFEPVRYATAALAIVTALIGANELAHVLPDAVTPYLLGAEALLTLLLGGAVRNRVTPTASPRDDGGRPLVPLPVSGLGQPRG